MPTTSTIKEATLGTLPIAQVVSQAIDHYRNQAGNLLPILHAIQSALGHIPPQAVPILADGLQLSRAEIHGVIRFYPYFHETPPAPRILEVCRAESCQAMGGNELADHAKRTLGCDFNENSPDGSTTLAPVYCLGLCALSPAVMLNGKPHARMTPERLEQLLHDTKVQA